MTIADFPAPVLANPMLSESFYEDCLKFASRIIRLEKCNLTSIDIVHDLIVETDINYSNYQKKIRSKILSERHHFRALPIDTIYYKRATPFKTNQDFTCSTCKDIFPDSERKRHFSSKGFYIERNTCKSCSNKVSNEWQKNARLQQLPYWFRRLERGRNYYQKNRELLLFKKRQKAALNSPKKEKVDWVKEKGLLSDRYITRLLYKKHKKADITEEMILDKRNLILIRPVATKMTYEEIRKRDREQKKHRYDNNLEFKKEYLIKVSEYGKSNREKRQLSKLKLKEARKGF